MNTNRSTERPTDPGYYFVDSPDRHEDNSHVVFLDDKGQIWGLGVAHPLDWQPHMLTNWRPAMDRAAVRACMRLADDLREQTSLTYSIVVDRMFKLASSRVQVQQRLQLAIEALRIARRSAAFDDAPSDVPVVTREAAARAIDSVLIDHLVEDRVDKIGKFYPINRTLPAAYYWTIPKEDYDLCLPWKPRLFADGQIEGRPESDYHIGGEISEIDVSFEDQICASIVDMLFSDGKEDHPIAQLTKLKIAERLRGGMPKPAEIEEGGATRHAPASALTPNP